VSFVYLGNDFLSMTMLSLTLKEQSCLSVEVNFCVMCYQLSNLLLAQMTYMVRQPNKVVLFWFSGIRILPRKGNSFVPYPTLQMCLRLLDLEII
jgi:hypothetical protein